MEKSRQLVTAFCLMSTLALVSAQMGTSPWSHYHPEMTFLVHHMRFRQRAPASPPLFRDRPSNMGSSGGFQSSSPRGPGNSYIAPQQPRIQQQPNLQQNPASINQVVPVRRNPACGVPPPTGECRGAFPRYYYNSATDQCDCFLYGGCGDEGIKYSFGTLRECHSACLPANKEEGPVCKNVFFEDQNEQFFFGPPASEEPSKPAVVPPRLLTDHIPDKVILTLFMNSINGDNNEQYEETNDIDNNF